MIDWVKYSLDCFDVPEIFGDRILRITKDGEPVWETKTYMPISGSYDSSIFVRTTSDYRLTIEGNPIKFLQGHNLFGTSDIKALVMELTRRVFRSIDLDMPLHVFDSIKKGDVRLLRVDCTEMVDFGSRRACQIYLHYISKYARSRNGTALTAGSTVYFAKNSRRWSIKFYSKGDEINSGKKHSLPKDIIHREELEAYADSKLRCELVLRSMELRQQGLDFLSKWNHNVANIILQMKLETIEMNENSNLSIDIIETLPRHLQYAYGTWLSGITIKDTCSKATYYRYRKEFLKHGIDISCPPPETSEPNNVVPINRVLTCSLATVPDFAKGTPLYFEPTTLIAVG